MVITMRIVITHHRPVVAAMLGRIDVRQVIPCHFAAAIHPNLAPENTVATFVWNAVGVVNKSSYQA